MLLQKYLFREKHLLIHESIVVLADLHSFKKKNEKYNAWEMYEN